MSKGRDIRGLTIEIGGDTTGLQNSLKNVNSQIKTTQAQLKDINNLLKLDPTNVELLQQKQKVLADEIESTKEKLETGQIESKLSGLLLSRYGYSTTVEQKTDFTNIDKLIEGIDRMADA